nr:hypothetical protein B456_002G180600 [Gossypium raimondii]
MFSSSLYFFFLMRLLIFTYNRNFVILGGEEGFQMLVDALVWDSDALRCCILHHVPLTGHACLWESWIT